MRNLAALVLAICTSVSAPAFYRPNQYRCVSNDWELFFYQDKLSILTLIPRGQPDRQVVVRTGDGSFEIIKSRLGKEVHFSVLEPGALLREYTLIIPFIQFGAILQSAQVDAELIETTTQIQRIVGQLNENNYFSLICSASHVIY